MARHIEDEVSYYYDSHPTEENLMGETSVHADLVRYLFDVLTWLFGGQLCAIYENLNFYQTTNEMEYPLAPDIAVIKGVNRPRVRSWRVGKSGSAPQVVFEIASDETWKKDLEEKPARYARMGVQEYFAYDPNEPLIIRGSARRLYGWRMDTGRHVMREIPASQNGALWSEFLESWLVPDGAFLRLYDRNWQPCLTEAESEARRAAIATSLAEIEAKRTAIATRRAEAEARRAEAEARRAEAEARRAEQAEAEAQRAHLLAEKLRSLGIDPDEI
jgi:Uma2 family endonuclease